MKKLITNGLCFIALTALLLSLAACQGGIDLNDGKLCAEDFFDYIEAGDLESAKERLHPNADIDLEARLAEIEEKEKFKFSGGVDFESYTTINTFSGATTERGSYTELTLKANVTVDGVEAEAEVLILKDSEGFGIYCFDVK